MIRLATLDEILPIRIEVLRNGKLEPTAYHAEDPLKETFHLAYLEDNQVIGIASFHPVGLKDYEGLGFQLRGMAVKSYAQNKGIGKKLLLFGENELKNRNVQYVWCNARQKAFPFYERLGYQFISDFFEVPMIGLHKKMLKYL